MTATTRNWIIIPAAGIGVRMAADRPKQYLLIQTKTIIEYTLDCFLSRCDIAGIVVAVAKTDPYWSDLSVAKQELVITTEGGDERYQSVLNGLRALAQMASPDDWVLVHDAARPCLQQAAIDRLMTALKHHTVGGLLALPCRDTIKQANSAQQIERTIERATLWQAQTPQMFRYEKLLSALETVQRENKIVTDEAMAMELSGYQPLLVHGHAENIKLTDQADLVAITRYLTGRL